MRMISHIETYEGPSWQVLQRDLELLEYTLLRKMKRKVWEYDYCRGNPYTSKAEQAKASRLATLFEQSMRERKRAWAAYVQEYGEKTLIDLMLPKLDRYTSFLEAKIKEGKRNE